MKTPIAVAVLLFCTFASAAEFPLGVWYEGGVGAFRHNLIPADPAEAARMYDRDFADIAAHGINTVVVPNTPAEHHRVLLDAAHKHKLRLIIELGPTGGDLGDMIRGQKPLSPDAITAFLDARLKPIQSHPALWKVQLLDEPERSAYGRYRAVADVLRKYDPAHEPFCCLAGVAHVEPYARETASNLVAWDYYPISDKTPAGDPAPMKAFAEAAASANQQAARANAHTWAVIQCHAITAIHRFPTPAEIRAMTSASLATGSRGIFWFLYQTEALDAQRKGIMSGMVDESFKSTDRWDEVAALARRIAAIGPVLEALTPADSSLVTANAFARVLKDTKGRFYVLAVNLDTTAPRKVSLRFGSASEVAGESEVFNVEKNGKLPVAHEGAEVLWDDEIPPGDAAIYRID